MNKNLKLGGCILLPILIGSLSGYLSGSGMDDWFRNLNKPAFNPPSQVFGPVWILLYILMGISFYRIIQSIESVDRRKAITWFIIQLFLNFMWSIIFFRWHHLSFAFAEIIILLAAIIIMLIYFRKIDRFAFLLQLPYLIWVSFATLLSGSFWMLNS